MATATYVPLATTTLGSAQNAITFSSIPSTYTDLKLVVVVNGNSGIATSWLRFNSDTASNYSDTMLWGTGSGSGSTISDISQTFIYLTENGYSTSNPMFYAIDIFSYAGSTYKTTLSTAAQDLNGTGSVETGVGLWRSTAAINSVSFLLGASRTMNIGTTATLYGIKAA